MIYGFLAGIIVYSVYAMWVIGDLYDEVSALKRRGIKARVNIYWPIVAIKAVLFISIITLFGRDHRCVPIRWSSSLVPEMGKRIEYPVGYKFPNTRLTYLGDAPKINPRVRRAYFKCDCGNTTDVPIAWVVHNNTSSCGCLRSELVAHKNTKHSQAIRDHKTGAYRSWAAMHNRCVFNPYYAGKRSVCDRWSGENGFNNFYSDMGDRPAGLTIERIDK